MSHYAVNGQEITDAMIERWCEAYEQGEFPDGERSTGKVVYGRPPLSADKTSTITIKLPLGMKEAVRRRAKQLGLTTSSYARNVLASDLLNFL